MSKLIEEYEFIFYVDNKRNAKLLKDAGLNVRLIHFGKRERLTYKLRKNIRLNHWCGKLKILHPLDYQFECEGVELVYFTGPHSISLFLERINYVITIWDLCHRDHPEFPEVRDRFEFEARENFLKSTLNKATSVVAESPYGRSNLIRRYSLDPEKVFHLWKTPSTKILSVDKINHEFEPRESLKIPENAEFIFYPAQFWPHKNHKLIVDAVHILKASFNKEIYAVFCGSDCGNLSPILNYSKSKKVDNLIRYAGFIPDEHMPHFYRKSLALIMPSLFGPTNMPPVEAFFMETPVVVSDLPGFGDQVGDAGILIDPFDPMKLANVILELSTNKSYRQKLIERGKKRAKLFTDEKRLNTLRKIFFSFFQKQSLWKFR